MPETALQRHEAAFIESFIAKRWRDRYRAKRGIPREDLSHTLEGRLDPSVVVQVNNVPALEELASLFERLPSDCVFISGVTRLDGPEYPVAKLLRGEAPTQWPDGTYREDTIVSIDPGRFAIFFPEPPGLRFICVADPAARAKIAKRFGTGK